MNESWVTRLERNVLFRIARFVAFMICLLLFLGLIGGAIYLVTTAHTGVDRPDPSAVVSALKPSAEQSQVGGNQTISELALPQTFLKGIKLPRELQEWILHPENQQWLQSSLEDVPEDQRQECVDGMAAAVRVAGSSIQLTTVVDAFMNQCREYGQASSAADTAAKIQRLYAVGAIASILLLMALFSLVLVLLAIERNTRSNTAPKSQ